jgi:hypothetical protein
MEYSHYHSHSHVCKQSFQHALGAGGSPYSMARRPAWPHYFSLWWNGTSEEHEEKKRSSKRIKLKGKYEKTSEYRGPLAMLTADLP